jgi:hypothetical protein
MSTDLTNPEATPADSTFAQQQSASQPQQPQQQSGNPPAKQENTEAGKAQTNNYEEYELEIPEEDGVDITLYKDATKALAKELNLSKEAAQKIIKRDIAMKAEGEKRIAALVEEQKTKWADQTRSDQEIGGQNLDRSLGDARAVLDRFGTPAFKREISESGYGNNVELIRILSRIGKAMREDGMVQAQQPARDSRKIADLMYPSMSAQQ